jgi:alpha-ketoglutarate-dependent taurine dioxygenase
LDCSFYEFHPPVVTSLLALKVPVGPTQTIRYDDGSGDSIENVALGATAFVSGEAAFEALSPELKEFALSTIAEYTPHPYIWIKNAKALSTGLGLVSEGLELPLSELPPYEESKIMKYPLVWKNKVTGKLSLQLHGCCVLDLITDGVAMGDLHQVRLKVDELMRPGIAPQRVYAHEWSEGDLVIFNNRSVWHTVVGTLRPDECRVYHQCNLAGSEPPLAP